MSPRVLIALAAAGAIVFGTGMIVWVLVQPGGTTAATSGLSEAQREHRKRFFGGDPDRDVRGGQELRPRW